MQGGSRSGEILAPLRRNRRRKDDRAVHRYAGCPPPVCSTPAGTCCASLYGEDYWTKFATLQPHGFDSYVQQFDRMVNGQDKLVHTAQYSAYLQQKANGTALEFVFPTDGVGTRHYPPRPSRPCLGCTVVPSTEGLQ